MAREDEANEQTRDTVGPGPTGGVISGPEGLVVFEQVKKAMKITAELNTMVTDDFDEIRRVFSKLVGKSVDETFRLIPPFYTNYGLNICIGRNVFVNYACSFIDLGGITIGDDVMIGPRVNLVTAGHPTDPSARRHGIVHKPITIEKNAWIGTAATILAGVTVGENSIVAAGAVVTKDVPTNCVVAGVPARVVKTL